MLLGEVYYNLTEQMNVTKENNMLNFLKCMYRRYRLTSAAIKLRWPLRVGIEKKRFTQPLLESYLKSRIN